ncbi:MAG: OmpA family protein [Hyphomicrobiaceae bacterium]
MRCRPTRWLWGLIPIALLAWYTVRSEHVRIEQDLKARTFQALKSEGLTWAGTGFSGRDGILAGRASEEGEPSRALQIIKRTWGVRVVDNQTGLIDKVEKFLWSASRKEANGKGGRIKLSGFVPNEESKKAIIGLVKATFPGHEVDDRTKLARGAPDRKVWFGGVSFALKQLSRLKRGQVDLENIDLTVTGEAVDAPSYKSVQSALRGGLPSGVKLKADRVTPPVMSPYLWGAQFAGGRLTLSGHVPSEAVRERLYAAVKRHFPKAGLLDRMELAAGEPDSWIAGIEVILREMARLESGTAKLEDATLSLRGVAIREDTAKSVMQSVHRGLPPIFRSSEQVTFREPTLKPVSPFTTTVTADARQIVLVGYAPSAQSIVAIESGARTRLPGRTVVNRLRVAAGAPEGWAGCVDAGLVSLGRLGAGEVAISDKKLLLTATTEDEKLYDALPGELRVKADRACETTARLTLKLPPEPNLNWKARLESGQVVLEGEVPSAEVQAELVKAAKTQFKGATVVDRTRIVAGRSAKWRRVALVGIAQLRRLRSGEAHIFGSELTLSGFAGDEASLGAIRRDLQGELPKGYVGRERVEVRSDAMLWSAQEAKRKAEQEAKRKAQDEAKRRAAQEEMEARIRRDLEEARRQVEAEARRPYSAGAELDGAKLRLTGEVPDEASRAAIVAFAKGERAGLLVEDAMTVMATGAPADWTRELQLGLRQLVKLKSGRLQLDKSAGLTLDGVTDSRQVERAVTRGFPRYVRGKRPAVTVRYQAPKVDVTRELQRKGTVTPDVCQELLRSVAVTGVIRFATGSAVIVKDSYPTLDKLAIVANKCPSVRFEISGHTDSTGSDRRNRDLSRMRAESIAAYLAKSGVKRARMHTVGYGSSKPVAPNNSPENMARNRRIEFTVKFD